MTQRRYIQMMQNAGLGDLYQKCTFDTYIASEEWQQRNKAAAMKYAGQDGNSWFLFAGVLFWNTRAYAALESSS